MFDFPSPASEGQFYAPSGGPQYVYTNGAWRMTGAADVSMTSIVQTVITTSGPYTKPAGLKFLEVTVVGGGGGGASANTTAAAQASCGGGGGAGGTVIKLFKASDLAATVTMTIGSGGIGQTAPTAGSTSSFATLSAGGGNGGVNMPPRTTPAVVGGGNGGTASGGDLNRPGEIGGYGWTFPSSTTYGQGGNGGSSLYGLGGRGPVSATSAAGLAGNFPGGGGGGSAVAASQTGVTGGDGSAGGIILKEYF